jgi:hypothetical protein
MAIPRWFLATAILTCGCTAANAQSAPFAGLAGRWNGSGTIELSDGPKERLRCKASYQVSHGEARLQQSLLCASDSYRFELSSDVISQQGQIAGSWSEASRAVSGSIVGRESGGSISAVVDAPGFEARLSLATKGNHQSFAITSDGYIRNVTISMSRD